ncbi:glycosyltransferase family 4 protein [Natrialba aegyptia]|uniref:glycosyltransferase family 4 protein n=1 Tax=Natrialba aegyptia TaxID=129789 RepID=UPI00373AF5BA
MRYLNSIALRAVDHVFIESEEQAQRIFSATQYERCRDQFTIFHKGIDTSEFDPRQFEGTREEEEFRIGTAASISPRKGLGYLIDALPTILAEKENVTLSIAGKPPDGGKEYKERLKERVHRHNIEDHVEFIGWIDDMPHFLNTLDVFVLPSLNEGIPGSVREALAMEVPVVATDVGGTSNVVIDGQNGYLIEPEDTTAIIQPVLSLLDNPSKRSSMGKRGREIIQELFSIENYNSQYEQFFRRVNETSD